MSDFIFVFWYWWVFAVILLVIEILVPGFFFLWMAVAGFITGLLAYLMPILSLNAQLVIFSVVSIVTIFVVKFYLLQGRKSDETLFLNQRGSQYIGRIVNLYEPIKNGQGKIKVDDSIWKVYGKDCNIPSRVKVVAVKGTAFEVEKID